MEKEELPVLLYERTSLADQSCYFVNRITGLPMRRILPILISIFCCCQVQAQKSLFISYNVEQGLGQSQATSIAQDSLRHIWVSHLGGLSRFDGKRFTNYTTADALASNFCNTVLVDKTGNVWAGTHTGLSVYNGHLFRNLPLLAEGRPSVVVSLVCDEQNRVWALAEGDLFLATTAGIAKQNLPLSDKKVQAIGLDNNRNLLLAIENAGIYCKNDLGWSLLYSTNFATGSDFKIRDLYTGPSGSLYLVSNKGIFVNRQGAWSVLPLGPSSSLQAFTLLEDDHGRIWIGYNKGLVRIHGNMVTHFNSSKGFTDHAVYSIMQDQEGNFWMATIGSGIIRFTDSQVTYFDKEWLGHIGVNGITQTSDGAIWFGTYGGGLRRYDGKNLSRFPLPQKKGGAQIINFCLADPTDGIWIGTQGSGLWYFKDGVFRDINPHPSVDNKAFYSGDVNEHGQTVFATQKGVYSFENGRLQAIGQDHVFANTAAFIGKDSILVGTPKGVQLLHKKSIAAFPDNAQLSTATVLCILRHGQQVMVGTADKGLFIVSLSDGNIRQYDMRQGLFSNCIYALAVDRQERIWLSTGNYLQYGLLQSNGGLSALSSIGKSKGILSPEGNTSSLLITDSLVWVGNLNGLNSIPLSETDSKELPLQVHLTDVQVFSSRQKAAAYADSIRPFYPVPEGLLLPHQQNHLTFSFHAISFQEADAIRYQYRIKGLEPEFSEATANNQVVYSSLPPGNHVLQVKAIGSEGRESPIMEYSFRIQVPYYQRWYFIAAVILLLLALAAGLMHLRNRWLQKKRLEKEELLKSERLRVRSRTAEDFHDDIGNKLTRINVLTEVLKNQLGPEPETDKLIEQIQESTASLYSSSRDLIWSLSHEEGSLYDLVARLNHFGKNLFQNTDMEFVVSDNDNSFKNISIAPELARNLALMVKEALHNSLKHSGAREIRFQVSLHLQNQVRILVSDNGRGFDTATATGGYGLANMANRARRLGIGLHRESIAGSGTRISLLFHPQTINHGESPSD